MIYEREYGTAATISFPLITFSLTSFHNSLTTTLFAAGDFKISQDYGAFTNTATLPAGVMGGEGVVLTLTAAELQAAHVHIQIKDQTATKVWEDQAVLIETFGNTTASQHAFNRNVAEQSVVVSSITSAALPISAEVASITSTVLPIAAEVASITTTVTPIQASLTANNAVVVSSITSTAFPLQASLTANNAVVVSSITSTASIEVSTMTSTVVLNNLGASALTQITNNLLELTITSTSYNADTVGQRFTFLDVASSSITAAINNTDVAAAVWGATQSAYATTTAAGQFGNLLDATISGFATGGDWTDGEKAQIRFALGVSGSTTAGSGGIIQSISSYVTSNLDLTLSTRLDATVSSRSSHTATDAANAVFNATITSTSFNADTTGERITAIDNKLPSGNISDFDETTDAVTLTANNVVQVGTITTSAVISNLGASATAQINAQVDTALSDIDLDKLTANTITAGSISADSVIAKLAGKGGDFSTYTTSTDSLEARGRQTVLSDDLGSATYNGTTPSITFPTGASTVDDMYNGCTVVVEFSGNRFVHQIVDYVGSTRVATLDHSVASSFGFANFGVFSPKANLINQLGSTATTQVNDQVVDVLKTDTITEQGAGAPPASPTFEQAIDYLYMAFRNQVVTTATKTSVSNDAGSTITSATVTDDGSTFTRGEFA